MRAFWTGTVSFGLVDIPVRVISAVEEHGIRFHQVHATDGGRIRMRRVCTTCGEEVSFDELAKGYQTPDGRHVVLTEDDMAGLLPATSREIVILMFVPSEQVDPILFDRTYYLEPAPGASESYVLLRQALATTDRMAVGKVALRQRETLAVLRVRGKAIMLQTLLWPDDVRAAHIADLPTDIDARPLELAMAQSLVEVLSGDFRPERYEDRYAKAVARLVEAKPADALAEPPAGGGESPRSDGGLLGALQRSVEQARSTLGGERAGDGDAERG
jgi:DNA end-binding protein Ku